jgi:hypothetical protein
MVSKWWTRRRRANGGDGGPHQLKIYGESILTGRNPKFRRIKLNAITLRFIEACWSGTDREINRNGTETHDRGREMFFLLRMTFWLGLVLVLLPREKTPESEKLPQIGATEAVHAATAAVSDMSQFCKRQPATCEVGGQAATVIGQRAQEGARKLYRIITDKKSPDHTSSISSLADTPPAGSAPQDTLTPEDLMSEWSVPSTP